MSEIKLCKECKHYRSNWLLAVYECGHPSLYKTSPIAGDKVPKHGYWTTVCFAVRAAGGVCGPVGDLHQPRQKPWWRFW